jgi:hypothetical protein
MDYNVEHRAKKAIGDRLFSSSENSNPRSEARLSESLFLWGSVSLASAWGPELRALGIAVEGFCS